MNPRLSIPYPQIYERLRKFWSSYHIHYRTPGKFRLAQRAKKGNCTVSDINKLIG